MIPLSRIRKTTEIHQNAENTRNLTGNSLTGMIGTRQAAGEEI